jgi:hypothetical protein
MNHLPKTTRTDVLPNLTMTVRMILRFVLAISFCLSAVVVAHAEPLTLTSGSFSLFTSPGFWSTSGNASGPNVSLSGGASNNCDIGPICPPSLILSSLINPIARGASVTIDGVTYNAVVIGFSFTDTTLKGTINVFSDRNAPRTLLFSMDFVGQGFTTVTTNPEFDSTLRVFTITTPTPEPASLFLIGLGVTGLTVKLKRSRKLRTHVDV